MEKSLVEFDQFLNILINNLSNAINRNIIPPEWLSGQEGSRYRMLHQRMLWILAKTGDTLNYVPEIDCGFSLGKDKTFRPDIQLWTKEPKLMFLIEYEGTNSQDSRILWKDLKHYTDSEESLVSPEYWIIIYTFPNHHVDKLPPWIQYGPNFNSIDADRFKRNPHSYFRNLLDIQMNNYIGQNLEWEKRKLFLMNLTNTSLEIDFPKHLQKIPV